MCGWVTCRSLHRCGNRSNRCLHPVPCWAVNNLCRWSPTCVAVQGDLLVMDEATITICVFAVTAALIFVMCRPFVRSVRLRHPCSVKILFLYDLSSLRLVAQKDHHFHPWWVPLTWAARFHLSECWRVWRYLKYLIPFLTDERTCHRLYRWSP